MLTIFQVDETSYDLKEDLGWMTDFPESFNAPKVRTNYKTIPGRNGELDLTEIDGHRYYEPIEFTIVANRLCRTSAEMIQYGSQLMNLFNGKRGRIYLDTADYYYDGRITVGAYERDGLRLGVELTIRAFPYRLAEEMTQITKTVSGSGTVTLSNGNMSVVPTITSTASMTLAWDTYSVLISAGEDILVPDLVLEDGDTEITLTGTGTITFTYQEGIF